MSSRASHLAFTAVVCDHESTRETSEMCEEEAQMARNGEWMTTGEAAEILDMHSESVRRYGKDGLLRITRMGKGHRRVWAESVRELARIHSMPDTPERAAALEALKRRNRGEPDPE